MLYVRYTQEYPLSRLNIFIRSQCCFFLGAFHMAAVVRKKLNDEEEPPELIGVITLEDIIEEIIKAEIVDETDVYSK